MSFFSGFVGLSWEVFWKLLKYTAILFKIFAEYIKRNKKNYHRL